MGVVAAVTAHQVAAARVLGQCLIADAAMGAHASCDGVRLTVAGRLLDVNQVRVHGFAVGLFNLEEGGSFVAASLHRVHMHRVLVLLFQDVAQLTELGQRCPAGLGGARTGYAMALTLQVHVPLQNLTRRKDH